MHAEHVGKRLLTESARLAVRTQIPAHGAL